MYILFMASVLSNLAKFTMEIFSQSLFVLIMFYGPDNEFICAFFRLSFIFPEKITILCKDGK